MRGVGWGSSIALAMGLGTALSALPLTSQDPTVSGEAEVGANASFGNTEQSVVLVRFGIERADSVLELSLGSLFAYGEASNAAGESFVNKRSWEFSSTADYHPHATLSPFVTGRVLSAFEKKIDLRWEAGVGAKFTFVDGEGTKLDISGALLAEKTVPMNLAAAPAGADDILARWSWRLRATRSFSEGRVTLDSRNFYRPEFGEWGSYTFTSTNSAAFRLTDRVSVKLSFLDEYDSEAKLRGARKNNDGQVLFSVLSTF